MLVLTNKCFKKPYRIGIKRAPEYVATEILMPNINTTCIKTGGNWVMSPKSNQGKDFAKR